MRGAGALALFAAATSLSACSSGSSSGALEHKACVEVRHSIALFTSAAHETGARASATRTAALTILRTALTPAALASADDADYQALSATLSESSRVPEGQLLVALRAQCAAVLTSS